ncbi:MAG TPA: anti-sigma factor [Candidatus Dormibacteraeota bacterium]|nr:anti-sigma factor [Candidatus Dormibacteraeota bacterium]
MIKDHREYEENVGAYLLGALSEHEAEQFERHVESCPSCRRELDDLRVASEALPRAVEPVAPPPELKESLMRTVWAEAGERQQEAKPERRWSRPFRGLLALKPAMAVGLAVAILLIGVGIGIAVGDLGSSSGGERTLAALVDHSRAPMGTASLTVPRGNGKGAILTVQGLPAPGPNKVYEVWVQRGGVMEPAGALFEVGSGGSGTAGIPGKLEGAEAVAVTAERAGGTLKPTQMPVITVKLT